MKIEVEMGDEKAPGGPEGPAKTAEADKLGMAKPVAQAAIEAAPIEAVAGGPGGRSPGGGGGRGGGDDDDGGDDDAGGPGGGRRPPGNPAGGGPRDRAGARQVLSDRLMGFMAGITSPPAILSGIVLLAMLFVYLIAQNPDGMPRVEYARGIITLLFAVGTIVIAVVLTFAAIFVEDTTKEKFAHGKEVLTLLIGIFGTILGFYFGSANDDASRRRATSDVESRGGVVKGGAVYLDNTAVRDADLIHLRDLPAVEKLYLDNTAVSDAGLKYLYLLDGLTYLSLRGTKVTAGGIEDLKTNFGKGLNGKDKLTVAFAEAKPAEVAPSPSPSPPTTPAADPGSPTPK